MIRLSLVIMSVLGSLLFFIWTVTLNNNNLIRAEINAATNCVSKVK